MPEYPQNVTVRPLMTWPGVLAPSRIESPFRTGYSAMMKEFTREIVAHKARNVEILVALHEGDFRKDGLPYANARPKHPGVILTWTTPDGTFSFPSDAFDRWEDNLLAIIRTVEKLRAVARYGVTKHGQQYAAWKAIESSASAETGFDSPIDAIAYLEKTGGTDDDTPLRLVISRAQRASHPDYGGTADQFRRVSEALTYLRDKGLIS